MARPELKPPLVFDPRLREHCDLLDRLPRCSQCFVRVPLPTRNGECLICLRQDSPKGSKLTPWPVEADAFEVDGEGGVAG